MFKELSEIEGAKETENADGEVPKETLQTVFKTDSQEDDSQREAEEEKTQEALRQRIVNLEREVAERKVAGSNAASEQEAGTAEATAAEEAHTDGNGQSPTPTIKTVEVLPLHGDMKSLDPGDIRKIIAGNSRLHMQRC